MTVVRPPKICIAGKNRIPDWADPVWHIYIARSPDRDGLQRRLTEAGIGTLIHYPIPPHMQAAYAGLGLTLARRLADEVLSLPMGPQLAMADAGRVIGAGQGAAG